MDSGGSTSNGLTKTLVQQQTCAGGLSTYIPLTNLTNASTLGLYQLVITTQDALSRVGNISITISANLYKTEQIDYISANNINKTLHICKYLTYSHQDDDGMWVYTLIAERGKSGDIQLVSLNFITNMVITTTIQETIACSLYYIE